MAVFGPNVLAQISTAVYLQQGRLRQPERQHHAAASSWRRLLTGAPVVHLTIHGRVNMTSRPSVARRTLAGISASVLLAFAGSAAAQNHPHGAANAPDARAEQPAVRSAKALPTGETAMFTVSQQPTSSRTAAPLKSRARPQQARPLAPQQREPVPKDSRSLPLPARPWAPQAQGPMSQSPSAKKDSNALPMVRVARPTSEE